MKKILIATNILLLGIIFFQGCNPKKDDKLAASSSTADPCLMRFCKAYDGRDLQGKIDVKSIMEMSQAYKGDEGKSFIKNTCVVVNDTHNIAKIGMGQDALSVVFDIEKLKNLIYQMECKAYTQHCDTSLKLGIRFYYIKYPCDLGPLRHKGDGLDGLTTGESSKHSLVMVPAYKNKVSKEWYDYNLWDIRTCFPWIGIKNSTDDAVGRFTGILPDAGDNHGGIGPPPEPGTFPSSDPNPPSQ